MPLTVEGVDGLLDPAALAGHALTLALTGTIALGAIRLMRSEIAPERYPRVGKWFVGGVLLDVGINLVLIAMFGSAFTLLQEFQWVIFAAALGGFAGLVVGGVEARAIDRAVSSERAAVQARALEAQRDWLDYLNSLLRHEVLNNANVISGYAELIAEADEGTDVTGHAITIRRQAHDMTSVIQDVRVFLDATQGGPTIHRVDLIETLRRELADVHDTFPEAETDLHVEAPVAVAADDVLGRVFANLFRNAIEHSDAPSPSVEVSVSTDDVVAAVRIADNGPGIPPSVRDSLFERGEGDHGLGLYLTSVLVDRYGGDVELTETGPDGSVFTVELPLDDAPTRARSDPSDTATGTFPLEPVSGSPISASTGADSTD